MAMLQRHGRVMERDGTMVIKDVFEQFLSEQQSQREHSVILTSHR
jgi:hypothetical protein